MEDTFQQPLAERVLKVLGLIIDKRTRAVKHDAEGWAEREAAALAKIKLEELAAETRGPTPPRVGAGVAGAGLTLAQYAAMAPHEREKLRKESPELIDQMAEAETARRR